MYTCSAQHCSDMYTLILVGYPTLIMTAAGQENVRGNTEACTHGLWGPEMEATPHIGCHGFRSRSIDAILLSVSSSISSRFDWMA